MRRSVQRVFLAVTVLAGVAPQIGLAQSGGTAWAYDGILGPAGSLQYRYAGYAPAYAGGGYSMSGGGCCGTAMYAPVASACCSPCGDPCGGACGAACGSSCGSACGGSPCNVAPSNGTTSSGKLSPTPDPATSRPSAPPREELPNPAPPYRREAPSDGFVPRDRSLDDAAGGTGSVPGRNLDDRGTATPATPRRPGGLNVPTETNPGFEDPVPRRPSDGGFFPTDPDSSSPPAGGGTPAPSGNGGTPVPFERDVDKPAIEEKSGVEGAEFIIPKRPAPTDIEPVNEEFEMPAEIENAGPKLEARRTTQAVAVKERLSLRPRFSAPTVARALVRPQGDWSAGTLTRLAGNP